MFIVGKWKRVPLIYSHFNSFIPSELFAEVIRPTVIDNGHNFRDNLTYFS